MALDLHLRPTKKITTLTISSGTADSDLVDHEEIGGFDRLLVVAPASLTGTVTVAILDDPDNDETADANWRTLYSGGATIEIPADGAVTIAEPHYPALRLESDSSEGADRVFTVYGIHAR